MKHLLKHPGKNKDKNAPASKGSLAAAPSSAGGTFMQTWPSLEISESDKEVQVKLEVPGLSEKDLELNYADGALIVKGEKKEAHEDRKRDLYYRESRYGSFVRSIPIGTNVDYEKAKAIYRDGILEVDLPKIAGSVRHRQIPIS